MTEQAVDIKTADGVADSHVFYPDGPGSWPAVIFFMDGIGIRPEMRAMARRLAAAGFDYRAEVYPGTRHGWAVPDPPVYQRKGAEHLRERIFALFRETLQAE